MECFGLLICKKKEVCMFSRDSRLLKSQSNNGWVACDFF